MGKTGKSSNVNTGGLVALQTLFTQLHKKNWNRKKMATQKNQYSFVCIFYKEIEKKSTNNLKRWEKSNIWSVSLFLFGFGNEMFLRTWINSDGLERVVLCVFVSAIKETECADNRGESLLNGTIWNL